MRHLGRLIIAALFVSTIATSPSAQRGPASAQIVTVKVRSGATFLGKLTAIDTSRLTIEVNGNKMDLLLEQVVSIEFQTPPPPTTAAQPLMTDSALPRDMTMWVIDGDTRFSKGVYHTRDCHLLMNHTPRPVRVADLPPKAIADDCVKRFQQSLQGKSTAFLDEAVRASVIVPDTAPVRIVSAPARIDYPHDLGVTLKGFYSLSIGDSLLDANITLGVIGEEVSRSKIGSSSSIMYEWKAPDGGAIIAIFNNDELVSKSQHSLR